MPTSFDIAIIGAGPAGMSAAITAAKAGASVAVIDEKSRAGGQIYRNVGNSPLADPSLLGEDYLSGRALLESFEACAAQMFFDAPVWHVADNGEVLFSQHNKTRSLSARELIVSNGAMERPFPIPGWHFPGVMSAGGAQVMLKSDAVVCDDGVFAGTGPLLYLIVAQYLRLGVRVKALVDTTPASAYFNAMGLVCGAFSNGKMLVKGLSLLNEIQRSGTPVYRFAHGLEIKSETQARSLNFTCRGKKLSLFADHIFLHQGVIPNLNMTRALGLEHHWCKQQLCWKPVLNRWGQSSLDNISVAGDGSGIVGGDGAALMGQIVALNQLYRLGHISKDKRNRLASPSQKKLQRLKPFRRFIDRLYRPLDECRIPVQPQTVVCRCEGVSLAQLKMGFHNGAHGPNKLKADTRCGMGPCQGRQCGHTVSELLAQWRHEKVDNIGYYRLRSPMRLLSLCELSRFKRVTPKSMSDKTQAAGGRQ